MSWNNILNDEDGIDVRNKINNAMNALFALFPVEVFWEDIGLNRISPTAGKEVEVQTVHAYVIWALQQLNAEDVNIGGELKLSGMTYPGEEGMVKHLGITPLGDVIAVNPEDPGEKPQGRGIITTFTGSEYQITADAPNIVVPNKTENVDLLLPIASASINMEVVVKKFYDNPYAVTIWFTGMVGGIAYKGDVQEGITTEGYNAWVRLKCDGAVWWVIQEGGNWELTTE